jgi:hypothetical protein
MPLPWGATLSETAGCAEWLGLPLGSTETGCHSFHVARRDSEFLVATSTGALPNRTRADVGDAGSSLPLTSARERLEAELLEPSKLGAGARSAQYEGIVDEPG